jgi:energy-converting hydrogenase B subunit D
VIPLQAVVLGLVAILGTAVVLARDPLRQAMVVGVYGFVLAVLFFVFQAPDVALSQIVVSSVVLPALALLTLARLAREKDDE